MRSISYSITALALTLAACSSSTESTGGGRKPAAGGQQAQPSGVLPVGAQGQGQAQVMVGMAQSEGGIVAQAQGTPVMQVGAPPLPNCGNSMIDPPPDAKIAGEVCDDGNQIGGDGCAANCLNAEPGFSCAEPGKPCLPIARCGDGIRAGSEQCDDLNRTPGDGCSATCKFEPGFKCDVDGMPCTATVCGDGKKEGGESCDDGNKIPFDGCSERCLSEPKCPAGGTGCTSACGDGIKLGANEMCDDGNTISGDGCSSDCKVESGFMCMPQANPPCEMVGGACVLRVPTVFRDFTDAHPDFGVNAAECTRPVSSSDSTKIPGNIVSPGIVQDTLNMMGRPALKVGTQKCDAQSNKTTYVGVTKLEDWFTDGAGRVTVPSSIVLFENTDGSFVNRYGAAGEKFEGLEDPDCDKVTNVGGSCPTGESCHTCSYDLGKTDGAKCVDDLSTYDGDPLFFPLDDQPGVPASDLGDAKIPGPYGYCAWPLEKDAKLARKAVKHNFYFTTEVQTWFLYDAMTNAKLSFTGDDDVWVFVNGKLALDLGGIHGPESGDVTISSATAAKYGLTPGNVYQLSVFQAERRQEGSSFRLTLAGFEATPSECQATCGDAVVAFGEECDSGTAGNVGGYGKCNAMCRLGEFCGDGIKNGPEQCDSGPKPSALCNNCRIPPLGT